MTEQRTLTLTRQAAAGLQIHAAIEHFHKHEPWCAITLAAAAEGILPDTEEEFLFKQLKTTGLKKHKNLDHLNFVQNWLKHGKYKGQEVESIKIRRFQFIAVISIQRAISKFMAVYQIDTPVMDEFFDWAVDNGYPAPIGEEPKTTPRLRLVR
jgi:hypothetical protein